MDIKVCDALCGSGKTSACIRMMNERVDTSFIFVTQFLSEVERVENACRQRMFVSPETGRHQSKLTDIRKLLNDGCNIATTHALFVSWTDDIKRLVREKKYVLVLDESVDALHMSGLRHCDTNLLLRGNFITEEDGKVNWIYDSYEKDDLDGNGRFSEEVKLAKSHNLMVYGNEYYFWSIPPELFTCFEEVYVLTYLFRAQPLKYFFDVYKLPYSLIGVKRDGELYSFCDIAEMDRRRDLRNMIHILENKKLNAVGDKRCDLSVSSYEFNRHSEGAGLLDRIRKNLINVFRNIYKANATDIMWTIFKDYREAASDLKYKTGFVAYNKRASNEYGDRHYMAYCVNNFMHPWETKYYKDHGVSVDQDTYAVSILIQWLFRSAIRNGEDVWIYVPSVRMRSLLKQWLNNLAEGRDLDPVSYKSPQRRLTSTHKRKERKNERKDVQEMRMV